MTSETPTGKGRGKWQSQLASHTKYHKELEDEYVAKSWRLGVSEGRSNKGWRPGSGKRDRPPQVYSEVCPLGSVVKKGETERTWGEGDAKWGREA